jgi:hypothetical protein
MTAEVMLAAQLMISKVVAKEANATNHSSTITNINLADLPMNLLACENTDFYIDDEE